MIQCHRFSEKSARAQEWDRKSWDEFQRLAVEVTEAGVGLQGELTRLESGYARKPQNWCLLYRCDSILSRRRYFDGLVLEAWLEGPLVCEFTAECMGTFI